MVELNWDFSDVFPIVIVQFVLDTLFESHSSLAQMLPICLIVVQILVYLRRGKLNCNDFTVSVE